MLITQVLTLLTCAQNILSCISYMLSIYEQKSQEIPEFRTLVFPDDRKHKLRRIRSAASCSAKFPLLARV